MSMNRLEEVVFFILFFNCSERGSHALNERKAKQKINRHVGEQIEMQPHFQPENSS